MADSAPMSSKRITGTTKKLASIQPARSSAPTRSPRIPRFPMLRRMLTTT